MQFELMCESCLVLLLSLLNFGLQGPFFGSYVGTFIALC